ncbi:MAG: hypothetical protein RIR26_434 [Pseudomonadota bacterium]|jgi:pSer/pThr/pTyr-binding forkhead associated (FHA) protein
MPFALQFMDGQVPGEILPLVGNSMTLGRSSGDLLLEDTEVSGRHCSLQLQSGELVIQDHGSRNGTWVNGQRTDRIKLHPGDVVKVGISEFRIVEWPLAADFMDPLSIVESWIRVCKGNDLSSMQHTIADLLSKEWELCLNDVQLKLTIESRDGRVMNHIVPVNEVVVGRSGAVPLLAEDEEASRKHARFFVSNQGRICVEDLGSANGSYVNEERLSGEREIRSSDVVRLGRTRIQVALFLPEFSEPILS